MEAKIKLTCPSCGMTGNAPASLAGKKVKCRQCGTIVELGQPAARPVAPASSIPLPPPPPPRPIEPGSVHSAPMAPATAPAPSPPGPPVPAVKDEVLLADQTLEGGSCHKCQKRIFLGDEVVRCGRCQSLYHIQCWETLEGCVAPACTGVAPVIDAQPATHASESTLPCPLCAEEIPVDAEICPFCSEPVIAAAAGMVVSEYGLPSSFQSSQGSLGKKWRFELTPETVTARVGKHELVVRRNDPSSSIELKGRHVTFLIADKKRKIPLDDIGYLALEQWLTGSVTKRSSVIARDALINAIIGIFCCQIVFGAVALTRSGHAVNEIRQYPDLITGEGMAIAAKVIGIVDLVLFVVGMFMRVSQMGDL